MPKIRDNWIDWGKNIFFTELVFIPVFMQVPVFLPLCLSTWTCIFHSLQQRWLWFLKLLRISISHNIEKCLVRVVLISDVDSGAERLWRPPAVSARPSSPRSFHSTLESLQMANAGGSCVLNWMSWNHCWFNFLFYVFLL